MKIPADPILRAYRRSYVQPFVVVVEEQVNDTYKVRFLPEIEISELTLPAREVYLDGEQITELDEDVQIKTIEVIYGPMGSYHIRVWLTDERIRNSPFTYIETKHLYNQEDAKQHCVLFHVEDAIDDCYVQVVVHNDDKTTATSIAKEVVRDGLVYYGTTEAEGGYRPHGNGKPNL